MYYQERLRMEAITVKRKKEYLLRNARINVRKGEVVGLLGLNNSGKTLLMNVLTGEASAEGRIFIDEEKVSISTRTQSRQQGIYYIHDENALLKNFTVVENVYYLRDKNGKNPFIQKKKIDSKAEEMFSVLGINVSLKKKAADLSIVENLMVQIAKAVASAAKIVIIDHILSALPQPGIDMLQDVFKCASSLGISFIILDFRPLALMGICSRIFILRNGRIAGVYESGRYDENELASVMLNNEEAGPISGTVSIRHSRDHAVPVLEMCDIHIKNVINGLSLKVYPSEAVGICLHSRKFKTALCNMIYGRESNVKGRMLVDGKEKVFRSPSDAINHKIAIISNRNEIFPNFSLFDNIVLMAGKLYSRLGFSQTNELKYIFSEAYSQYFYPDTDLQKHSAARDFDKYHSFLISVCRKLCINPKVLIYDNVFKNMDMVSSNKALNTIDKLVSHECSGLLISSNINELMAICNRIYFIIHGKVSNTIHVQQTDLKDIMAYYKYFATFMED